MSLEKYALKELKPRVLKNTYENSNVFIFPINISESGVGTITDETFVEFVDYITTYITTYNSLLEINPNILHVINMIVEYPSIHIITNFTGYNRTVYKKIIDSSISVIIDTLRECLEKLEFFHSNNFVYKYIDEFTMFTDKNDRVEFGFGGNSQDPLFTIGLIHQAIPKSDIFSLGVVFSGGRSDFIGLADKDIGVYVDEYNSIVNRIISQHEEKEDKYTVFNYANLIARMVCFLEIRPTAQQALDLLNGKQVDLPNMSSFIEKIRDVHN